MSNILTISAFLFAFTAISVQSQTFPESSLVTIPGGTFTMGEPKTEYQGLPGSYDVPEHTVTLSSFKMCKTEITNEQYVDFLNAAFEDGLLEVAVENIFVPDLGSLLVYGTDAAPDDYKNQAILNLSGTRVMKDHDNADGDDDPFTGVIEPENPLNLCYIGFDDTRGEGEKFYVKDPADANDFDWQQLTNYYNWGTTSHTENQSMLLNDYNDWPELADFTNNMPTLEEVNTWPASFIRWYGAKAFALYYGLSLPTWI